MTRLPFDIRSVDETNLTNARDLLDQARGAARNFRGHELLLERLDDFARGAVEGRLAVHDDRVVGGILWSQADGDLIIEVLFVNPASRTIGIGEHLVHEALDYATERGLTRVLGRALPGDRETKNVFERTGLISQVILVGRTIG